MASLIRAVPAYKGLMPAEAKGLVVLKTVSRLIDPGDEIPESIEISVAGDLKGFLVELPGCFSLASHHRENSLGVNTAAAPPDMPILVFDGFPPSQG